MNDVMKIPLKEDLAKEIYNCTMVYTHSEKIYVKVFTKKTTDHHSNLPFLTNPGERSWPSFPSI